MKDINPRDVTLGDYLEKVVQLRRESCVPTIDTDIDIDVHRHIETEMRDDYYQELAFECLSLNENWSI